MGSGWSCVGMDELVGNSELCGVDCLDRLDCLGVRTLLADCTWLILTGRGRERENERKRKRKRQRTNGCRDLITQRPSTVSQVFLPLTCKHGFGSGSQTGRLISRLSNYVDVCPGFATGHGKERTTCRLSALLPPGP